MKQIDTTDSFETLAKRYSSPAFLEKAALRRAHLDYVKISFGKLSPEKNYLRMLLPQAHSAYYTGNFYSVVAVCGSMLESLLQIVITEDLEKNGAIDFHFSFQGEYIPSIDNIETIDLMTFNDKINCFKKQRYLPLNV